MNEFEKSVAQHLKLENISISKDAKLKGESAKDIFCKNWGSARDALEAIRELVKNPVVKLIISILISTGDGLKSSICR